MTMDNCGKFLFSARNTPSRGGGAQCAHWAGVEWRKGTDGKSLVLRTDFQLSTRIPLPTSLRSATFPPGEGITQINWNLRQQNRIGRNHDASWAVWLAGTNCPRVLPAKQEFTVLESCRKIWYTGEKHTHGGALCITDTNWTIPTRIAATST